MCGRACICIYINTQKQIFRHIHAHSCVHVCVRKILCNTLLIALHSTHYIHCTMYSSMVFMFSLLEYTSTCFLCYQSMFIIYYLKMNCNDKGFNGSPTVLSI